MDVEELNRQMAHWAIEELQAVVSDQGSRLEVLLQTLRTGPEDLNEATDSADEVTDSAVQDIREAVNGVRTEMERAWDSLAGAITEVVKALMNF
jgi:uncharacterized protein YoxC